jgi:hypothetical protein
MRLRDIAGANQANMRGHEGGIVPTRGKKRLRR